MRRGAVRERMRRRGLYLFLVHGLRASKPSRIRTDRRTEPLFMRRPWREKASADVLSADSFACTGRLRGSTSNHNVTNTDPCAASVP